MEKFMKNKCVCCGKETYGKCGDDIVCFECYKSHRYKWFLLSIEAKEHAKAIIGASQNGV